MARINLIRSFLLMIIGAIGLWLAWPSISVTGLLFVGLVPFLLVEDHFFEDQQASGRLYLGVTYFGLLLWNTLTTYWVMKATIGGGLMAMIANSALMTIPFAGFHALRTRLNWPWGLAFTALVSLWLSLELLHLNWQLAWPWLNLGNGFAGQPNWVQWYEYTGAFGGSLWIWLANGLCFLVVKKGLKDGFQPKDRTFQSLIGLLIVCIAVPVAWSATFPSSYNGYHQAKATVVQPNVDPYEDKFDKQAYDDQLANLINLSESASDQKTDLVIWPETSLPDNYNEGRFLQEARVGKVMDFLAANPQFCVLTGLNSYVMYEHKATPTARTSNGNYYDVFNAAVALDTNKNPIFYHKSILVPGVERMPYPSVLGFLENLAIEMGGTSGSLGSQEEASVMPINDSLTVAPVICYESVFGGYVGDYVEKGANLIAVITNDGWWGDTDGYRQHFAYSILRAIEMRRSIARSANTGISGFILPSGEVIKATPYWEEAAVQAKLPLRKEKTFYAKFGDYIGYIGLTILVCLMVLASLQRLRLVPRFSEN